MSKERKRHVIPGEVITSGPYRAEQNTIQVGDNIVSTICLLYTSPSPRDKRQSRMPSSA